MMTTPNIEVHGAFLLTGGDDDVPDLLLRALELTFPRVDFCTSMDDHNVLVRGNNWSDVTGDPAIQAAVERYLCGDEDELHRLVDVLERRQTGE